MKKSARKRAEFMANTLKNTDLDILSSREYDSCLEMGDAEKVLKILVTLIPSWYSLSGISQRYSSEAWWDLYREK